jgi:CrcB protein
MRPQRPVHLRWQYLALVAVGGAAGTAAREALTLVIPQWGAFPTNTFIINVVGAFALGVLLEALVRRGPDEGRRRSIRLLAGTGILGGFTTYSSLATDAALRLDPSRLGTALLYSIGTVVVGGLAAWAGIAVSSAVHRRRLRLAAGRRGVRS